MIDCWLWDLVDCMRHEEEKILGMNTTYTVEHMQKGPTLFASEHTEKIAALVKEQLAQSAATAKKR